MQSSPTSMSFSCSRPGRFTRESDRWKKIRRAIGMSDMSLFWGGVTHTSANHVLYPREFWLPYILNATKACRIPTDYITESDSAQLSPYSRLYEYSLITVARTSRWGSLTDSIFHTIHPFRVPHHTIYVRVPCEEGRALHPNATTAIQAAAAHNQNTSTASQNSKDPPPFSS